MSEPPEQIAVQRITLGLAAAGSGCGRRTDIGATNDNLTLTRVQDDRP